MRNFQFRRNGLTLVEVLVSMGIAAVVGLLLLVVMINSTGLYTKQSSKVEQGLNLNDIFSQVRSTVKQASAIAVSYTDGATTYTTGASQLVLKIASVDSSKNIIENTFDYFVFFLDQNIFRLRTFPNVLSSRQPVNQVFSTGTDSLRFQYFNTAAPPVEVAPETASKIRITIVLKQKTGSSTETSIATSEANLRND